MQLSLKRMPSDAGIRFSSNFFTFLERIKLNTRFPSDSFPQEVRNAVLGNPIFNSNPVVKSLIRKNEKINEGFLFSEYIYLNIHVCMNIYIYKLAVSLVCMSSN